MGKQQKPVEVLLSDFGDLGRGALIMRQGRLKTPSSVLIEEAEIDHVIERLQAVKAELKAAD